MIRRGYVKVNGSIPELTILDPVEVGESKHVKINGAVIECESPTEIKLNVDLYKLLPGKHYIPPLIPYVSGFKTEHTKITNYIAFPPRNFVFDYDVVLEGVFNTPVLLAKGCIGALEFLEDSRFYTVSKHVPTDVKIHYDLTTTSIYDNNVDKIQSDPEVTKYLKDWTKDWVIFTNPPCIDISYELKNREALQIVLKDKYGVRLPSFKPMIEQLLDLKHIRKLQMDMRNIIILLTSW